MFTPDQKAQMAAAVFQQFMTLIPMFGALLGALVVAVTLIFGRLGRQGRKLEALANGEGDEKAKKVIMSLIGSGHIAAGPAIPNARDPSAQTRRSDGVQGATPPQEGI